MRTLKLRTWVKVVLSIMIIFLLLFLYTRVGYSTSNMNQLYWLCFIPFSGITMLYLWEE